MENPKYIELDFENLEAAIIDMSDITNLSVRDIKESHRFWHSHGKNFASIIRECSRLDLLLPLSANKECDVVFEDKGILLFDRLLKYDDIVSIAYLDEEKNPISVIEVPWNYEDSETENTFQKTSIGDDGSIRIIIDKSNSEENK